MVSSTVTLTANSGSSFSAHIAQPSKPNGGGVVVLQEIFGVNANMRSVASDLADAGFFAVVPDLFWRQQPGIELDPETDRARATELMKGLDSELAVRDSLVAAAYIRTLPGANGKVGAVGFCLGGKLAYLLSMQPQIAVAVSYYGVAIHGKLDEIGHVRCPLLMHIAEQDPLCPPEAQRAIERAAAKHADRVSCIRYPGVTHAFARRGSPAFNRESAERAHELTNELLRKMLVDR